jgi:hypothetical protein
VRVPRRPLLPTVSVALLLAGLLAAVLVPTVSAAAPVQHPVRPQVHKLPLAGVTPRRSPSSASRILAHTRRS